MPNARLIIVSPDQPDREIMLDGGASIGRAFDNTVCIASAGVSRYHAVIEQRADGFWLSDLDSINGTAVNGDPVTSERKLNEGDVIAVGEGGEIRFHLDDTGLKPAQEMAQPPASVDTPDEAPRPQEAPPVEPKAPPAKRSALLIFGAVAAGLAVTIVVALVILSSKSGGDVATARGGASASVAAQKNTEAKSGRESPAGSTAPEPVAPAPTSGETSVSGAIMSDLSARGDTNVAALAQNLAGLIVRKSGYGYTFAPDFVAQIRRRAEEYRVDISGQVRRHRFEINKAFSNSPLHPATGYVLALSQSKFQEAGDSGSAGLWRVPTAIALNYKAPEESDAALRDPARSAEIAALYLKSLIDIFGPDDFMYAIACFGMPTSQAGDLKNLLDEKADADARRDFWRMARAGVVPPEGADRVVRFFAAGVVAENPQAFGVGGQPLSWLISN